MTPVRLGTIPDAHPYLDAVLPESVRHVRFAPESATGWEPSPLLRSAPRRAALTGLDVLHLHFGYESSSVAEVAELVADVRRAGVGLVVTVHDLRNPHDPDNSRHLAQLGALVEAADAVLTLTPGAAMDIGRRWSRTAVVTPHPTLLARPAPRRRPGAPTVGLHLKSLRANVAEPLALVEAAAAGARDAGARLRVDVHRPGAPPALLADLVALAARQDVDLRAHARFCDDELLEYLAGLHACVLPYRFGTHSGWLEMCRDVGVRVVAPDCGYYAEQWPAVQEYSNNERSGLDCSSLRRAVLAALADPRPDPADRRARQAQRDRIRLVHGDLYARIATVRAAG